MESVLGIVRQVTLKQRWFLHVLEMGTVLSVMGIYLGTTCTSIGASLLLILGLPLLLIEKGAFWRHPLTKPCLFFILTLLLSMNFAETYAFSKILFKFRYFLCLFVASYVFSYRSGLRLLFLKMFWVLPCVLGPLSILQYFHIFYPLRSWFGIETSPVASGLVTHHTAFGLSMVYAFLFLAPQIRHRQSGRKKATLVVGCALCIAGVFCSFSRGALVALLGSVFALLLLWRSLIGKWIVTGGVVLACLIPISLSDSIKERFTSFSKDKFTDRIELLSFAWDEFKAHPILGHGYGRFPLELDKFPERKARANGHGHAHNIYLDLLAGSGVLGLIGFLWLIWAIYRELLRSIGEANQQNHEQQSWFLSLVGVWTAFLVGGLFDEYLLWSQILVPSLVLVGSACDWPSTKDNQ